MSRPVPSDPSVWRVRGTPLLAPLAVGPLSGTTVAVKDLFAVGGFPVGAGNPAWLAGAAAESEDAWAVRALRTAGAAIAGIARTDELAFSLSGANAHYGAPPNPAAPALVTGGSSSGPAAAVAAGEADIGLGTDTAGSVRVPASVCGLFGMRPTHGAVPADRVVPLAPSFDTVGWLTAGPGLLRAVGSVLLTAPGPADPPHRLLSADIPNERLSLLTATLDLTAADGALPGMSDVDGLLAAFRTVQAAQAWELHGDWITAHPGALAPDVAARFLAGAEVDAQARRRAATVLADGRAWFLDALGDDGLLALPAAGGPGHRRDAPAAARDAWRQATLRRTVLASAFGLPSCVVPTGTRPPEGLALVGPPGADHVLLDAAVAVAAALFPDPGRDVAGSAVT